MISIELGNFIEKNKSEITTSIIKEVVGHIRSENFVYEYEIKTKKEDVEFIFKCPNNKISMFKVTFSAYLNKEENKNEDSRSYAFSIKSSEIKILNVGEINVSNILQIVKIVEQSTKDWRTFYVSKENN